MVSQFAFAAFAFVALSGGLGWLVHVCGGLEVLEGLEVA